MQHLANKLRHIVRHREQLIYEQGESAHGWYWLCQGRVQLAHWNRSGKRQFIRFVELGQLFGAEALTNRVAYDHDA